MSDKLRNLIVRALSGAVLLAIVVAAAWFGENSYGALLFTIVVVGVWEFYRLAEAKGIEPQRWLGLLTSVTLFVSAFCLYMLAVGEVCCTCYEVIMWGSAIALPLLLSAIFVVEVFRNRQQPMLNIATTLMGIIYVALPMSMLLYIPSFIAGSSEWRPEIFLFYLFLVWGNDVFAYLVGILFGKHKMCVRLSPKKSWEGFFGGVAGSLAMGVLGAYVVGGSVAMWLGLALVVSLTSVLGDLVESMFKREVGVKDSGNIMPGHGGMLDRFDALILSAPFAFVYLLFVMLI